MNALLFSPEAARRIARPSVNTVSNTKSRARQTGWTFHSV